MRFVIPKGDTFYCEFTVKEPGTNVAKDLTGATGTFDLSTIGPNVTSVLSGVALTFPDAVNGIAAVTLSSAQTTGLSSRRGFAEDGYPIVPTYKGALNISADNPIYVEIPQIYISDNG